MIGFEFYRKLLTTLHGKMNSVYLAAQSNAERRAQMVLARIANKVREASNKKNGAGRRYGRLILSVRISRRRCVAESSARAKRSGR